MPNTPTCIVVEPDSKDNHKKYEKFGINWFITRNLTFEMFSLIFKHILSEINWSNNISPTNNQDKQILSEEKNSSLLQ